jgi:lysyl-tRNA synthetase class 2
MRKKKYMSSMNDKSQKTWQLLRTHPELLPRYLVRERVIDTIRAFFKEREYREVETPLLVEVPSTETYLDFFSTQLRWAQGGKQQGFLTTSPEYSMKKLLVAGMPKIFQICKSFRNSEGVSGRHNPEFTILEWYEAGVDYTSTMTDCEELFQRLWDVRLDQKNTDKNILIYKGKKYNLNSKWTRITVAEVFTKFANVSVEELLDEKALLAIATKKGYTMTPEASWEEAYNQIFLNEVEPRLAEFDTPVILYEYPASQAALSRRCPRDPRFAERFEFYLGGIELGNAFSELTDPVEQHQRLQGDIALRQRENRPPFEIDMDFIKALEAGMPEAAGIAVGVDRLVMLLADADSIHHTQFFPVYDVFSSLN